MAEPLRRVGRYEILGVVGRGGTAIVHLATQPDLDRQVALKELSPHHAGDVRFAERFIEESRLIGAMNHPNIVTVHQFFEHDGVPHISMEYLTRGSLRPYLTTLAPVQIFGVAENVLAAQALGQPLGPGAHLYSLGIIIWAARAALAMRGAHPPRTGRRGDRPGGGNRGERY